MCAAFVGIGHARSSYVQRQERKAMLYAILCYNSEAVVESWPKEKDDAVMLHHVTAMRGFIEKGKMGPVARLMPTTAATTLRAGDEPLVLDGPFAETKEQLLGFYVVDCATLDEALETAKNFLGEIGAVEVRPIRFYEPGAALK
jgi:hypothetical protein